MEEWIRYRGKNYTLREIDEIREILIAYPERSRRFISQEICRRWGWRQPNGVLKDMICRGLLLQLEAQGYIELPARKKNPLNPLSRHQKPQIVEVDQRPCTGKLSDLRPVELVAVRRTPWEKLYQGVDPTVSLFGLYAAGRGAFGIPCDVERAASRLLRVVFSSSSYWMSRSLFGMDPRATDKESFRGGGQHPVSHFALGERSSFSFPSFRAQCPKDLSGLGEALPPWGRLVGNLRRPRARI